jgi:hypothetical protein
MRTILIALACALMLIPDVAAKDPVKKARPPKPEELVGAWIGFREDQDFARLQLRADSTGFCAFVASPQSITHDYGVQVVSGDPMDA